jgi:phosphoribosylformimino-5-aminoimidazole carboxamide ribotide isomerase
VTFTVLPAIDVRDGAVIRLKQGDYGRQTTYGPSPLEMIKGYAEDGASWLHLVDLDAARAGRYSLVPLLEEIRSATGLKIQTGGGVRREEDIEALVKAGAERVVVGTMSVREPDRVAGWIRAFGPDRITLALDTRQDGEGRWLLPVEGWTEATALTLDRMLRHYEGTGLRHVLCTDIARDGMLSGFNLDLYRKLATDFPSLDIQASGGARSLDDIRAAKAAGARAAILGRALLDRRFELEEALRC